MSTTTRRRGISRTNTILISALVAGAVVTAITRNWTGTTFLTALALGGLICALSAARASASDSTRVNGLHYRDERDRELGRQGFSVVGAAALILSVAEMLFATMFQQYYGLAVIQLVVLSIVWGIANTIAVRKG